MEKEFIIALIGIFSVLAGSGLTHYFNIVAQKQKLKYDEKHYLNNIKRQKLEEMFIILEELIKFAKSTPFSMIQMHVNKKIDFSNSKYSFDKFSLFKNYAYMYFNDKIKLIQAIKDFELQYEKAVEINGHVITNIESYKEDNFKKINANLLIEWGKAKKKLQKISEYLPNIYNEMIEQA